MYRQDPLLTSNPFSAFDEPLASGELFSSVSAATAYYASSVARPLCTACLHEKTLTQVGHDQAAAELLFFVKTLNAQKRVEPTPLPATLSASATTGIGIVAPVHEPQTLFAYRAIHSATTVPSPTFACNDTHSQVNTGISAASHAVADVQDDAMDVDDGDDESSDGEADPSWDEVDEEEEEDLDHLYVTYNGY